ncbi:MAG TPA: 30S ribosome-binding factor RbfA [Clostridiales bacterium]|nr:30S ribosome-binding factor RbfA [Clostridiales bacterium]
MSKHRDDRIGEELKKEISDIIQNEMKDPDLGFVSIVLVEVSRDLRVAKIYYSVMGSEEEIAKTKQAMKRSAGFVRHELAGRLSLRYTPELVFIYDNSIEHGIRINRILNEEIKKETKKQGSEDEKES